jgi:hypothetical protein
VNNKTRMDCRRQTELVLLGLVLLLLACTMPTLAAGSGAKSDFTCAMSLLKAKQYHRALFCFDRSVDAEPTNATCHYWRGKCLSGMGRAKEAVAEYKLAVLLGADPGLKDSCRQELARYHVPLPEGSVDSSSTASGGNVVASSEKLFTLSSKKVDWNLQMSKDFLQSMKARTAHLEWLARTDRWQVPAGAVALGPHRRKAAQLAASLKDGPAHNVTPLSSQEKQLLALADVVIILDHSGSMMTCDCPGRLGEAVERLSWCTEELDAFADNLADVVPQGFHFIAFDFHPQSFAVSRSAQLRHLLQQLSGGGGTDLAGALEEAFRLHGAHRQQPLLIAVLSDAQVDLHSSVQTIVKATRAFPLPNGVFITLLQIGIEAEPVVEPTMDGLKHLEISSGAAYDAFAGVPFSQLRRDGMGRCLLQGLQGTGLSAGKAPRPPVNKQQDREHL